MDLGREELEPVIPTFLYIDGSSGWVCKWIKCLQLTSFHEFFKNYIVLIAFSSSRDFNSRVQTIDLKKLHFHSQYQFEINA